jgi:N-acetylmuramoyl-L-alanine amidase
VKKALSLALLFLLAAAAAVPVASPSQAPTQPASPPAAASLSRKLTIVVIDPAHGGADSGARGPSGTSESEAVVDFGRAIRVALEARGFHAVLTREGNQGPSFDDRAALVNGLSGAVFITLHVSSTGTPGTARAYFCLIPPAPPRPQAAGAAPATSRRPPGLLDWDRAQESYLDLSRRLAELVQIQLAQQFQGSPEIPSSAPIRQLRTVAAPAIAIEVSNIASGAASLSQMGQPLGEALARAAAAFQQALAESDAGTGAAR